MTCFSPSRALLVLLVLLGAVGSQPVDPNDFTADSARAHATTSSVYCLRPMNSQNDFQVLVTLEPEEDAEDRQEYYAGFGKEMVQEGSIVLYKGRMALLNADCSVQGLEFDFPTSHAPYSGGVMIPMLCVLVSMLVFLKR